MGDEEATRAPLAEDQAGSSPQTYISVRQNHSWVLKARIVQHVTRLALPHVAVAMTCMTVAGVCMAAQPPLPSRRRPLFYSTPQTRSNLNAKQLAPLEMPHLKNNAKKIQQRKEWEQRTARENTLLLGRLYKVLSRPGDPSVQQTRQQDEAATDMLEQSTLAKRRREQQRIDAENTALMARIRSVESIFSPRRLEQEWRVIERAAGKKNLVLELPLPPSNHQNQNVPKEDNLLTQLKRAGARGSGPPSPRSKSAHKNARPPENVGAHAMEEEEAQEDNEPQAELEAEAVEEPPVEDVAGAE